MNEDFPIWGDNEIACDLIDAVEALASELNYADSYGVYGSDFVVCYSCNAGGAPNISCDHKDDCKVVAARKAADDAANALATAEARLALLESVLAEAGEALKPFAAEGISWTRPECTDDKSPHVCIDVEWGIVPAEYTFGHLRRAATVSAKIDAMDAAQENGK